MQQRSFGAGGPQVGAIGLGCMSLGGQMYGSTTEADSLACLDAAYDAGISHFDTANIYGMGVSETVLGKWIASRKPQIHLATKASIIPGPPRNVDNSPDYLRAELEGSLRRLRAERVDLFYLHRRDPKTPLDEAIGGVARLIEEGKIGGYGLSEVAPATVRRAHAIHPCTAVQNEYSLWTRQPELGVVQACRELGVAFVPFSPLARGMFSDTPLDPAAFTDPFRLHNPRFVGGAFDRNAAAVARFRAFAAERGWSCPALAIAWVLAQGEHMIPIPGTRSAAHVGGWAGADQIRLTAEDLAEIARILPIGFAEGARYSEGQTLGVEAYC